MAFARPPSVATPRSLLLGASLAPLLLLLALLGSPPSAAAAGRRCDAVAIGDKYTDRYDNVDVDAILNSNRLLKAYIECIMERGVCTKEGCFLKAVLPDALNSECSKCNDKQRKIAGKILSFLLQYHRQDYWDEILKKYDPTGEFRKRYEYTEEDEDDPDD